jgi:two-component system NtrC family sensor kinase
VNDIVGFNLSLPPQHLKAALIVFFLSVLVLVGLAFQKIRSYKSKTDLLQKKVISTEERYRSLFDQATEGIVITDAELRILELNQTAKRLLGMDGAATGSATFAGFCRLNPALDPPPHTGAEWFSALCRPHALSLVRRDGSITPAEVDGALIRFEGRAAYQFFLRELTERPRLEHQLRQAEKLSALGQMISGVAHELNNPLAVIKGYVELILTRHEVPEPTRADLKKVAHESDRAAKLVSNFLSFARQQPIHRETVDPNELVHRTAELHRLDLQKIGVQLRLDLSPDLPPTQADPDQIQQVLVILVNNALDVLAAGAGPGIIQIRTQRKEDNVVVIVEDNGPGVPAEVLPYIFEPFYTTKEVGKGTGLGLSIAHSVLADHGGRIFHQPAKTGGAIFAFELPIVRAVREGDTDVSPAAPALGPGNPPSQDTEILILDDERAIAELLGEMLNMLGYSTALCHSGQEALELLERRDFDLIISDYRMPGMNGQEFYRLAIEKKSELAKRVIFLTGDVVNEDTQSFLRSMTNPHLSKPFQLARIEQLIVEVLQRNSLFEQSV